MSQERLDAIVVRAGFSGLYMLHRLREFGLRAGSLEKAVNVGATWLFNRCPGAHCDIESIEYSDSFSEQIEQEWVCTETMQARPEIEAYLSFVADRLDLRRDISFGTAAQREWIEHTTSLVAPTVLVHPTHNSWYRGANVPGKKRMYMG